MKQKLKESDLREMAECALCKKGFGHTNAPVFYRIAIAQYAVNMRALQRQQGLGQMIGAPLAAVMGPNETMAELLNAPSEITVCNACVFQPINPLMFMGDDDNDS